MTAMDERREAAINRLKAKRDFRTHLAVYVVVNTILVVIWAASGAGYFWPIWVMGGWGIGLAFNAFACFSFHFFRLFRFDRRYFWMYRLRRLPISFSKKAIMSAVSRKLFLAFSICDVGV